jgi:cyclopropane fatty-acyl-phospholipid synthase-like methyltransferase
LELADLKPDEMLYDLGAGDGRVLILAAREFGARGIGIEAGFLQVIYARLSARFNGVSSKVRMRRGNFYKADLSEVDVVFAYLTSDQAGPLQKQLKAQLKTGSRVVTVSFDLPGWQPLAFDREYLIFLYKMPAIEVHPSSFPNE